MTWAVLMKEIMYGRSFTLACRQEMPLASLRDENLYKQMFLIKLRGLSKVARLDVPMHGVCGDIKEWGEHRQYCIECKFRNH